ncbi:novel immune-type receptor 6a precursor [Danio rerio]|uniref:Novel immune-type receptor 6a n=1 Tax=Danio rerio TaxID=7955 RepID=Q3B7R5_DANRE|nr:novel immune-type receptor 6a precursor [Danio rerio]AAI07498.1 Novel immune-type receptor 6a [Danio rerio]|eukprot:NP_954581.3 novel immune-type receptor 6a precursor [Danio rerio]
MIFWFILMCWAPGAQSNHSAEIVSLQTFKLGDDVIIKCFSTKISLGNTLVWYKQKTGQIPRAITISYIQLNKVIFEDEFKDGRFSILPSEDSFHLNITAATKQDTGIYYCGTVSLNLIEFISGAHLMLQGTEYVDVNMTYGKIPAGNGTPVKNADDIFQKEWHPVLLCLIFSNVVFVVVTIIILADRCIHWRKRHRGLEMVASPSCEIRDSDVNYTAVSFASVPPARRSNNRQKAEYSEVNLKSRDYMI